MLNYFDDEDDDNIIDLSCLSPEKREAALLVLRARQVKEGEEEPEEKNEDASRKTNGLLPPRALERLNNGNLRSRVNEDETKWLSYANALNSIEIKERKAENVDDRKLYRKLQELCEKHHLSDSLAKAMLPIMIAYAQGRDVKPIIFYGPAGCGKTYFASLLAELIERPLVRISAPRAELSHGYQGEVATYKNPDAGEFIRGMVDTGSESCVFFIDEIDKAADNPTTRVKQQDELLNIISDKTVNDNFMGFPISVASSVIVFAVNDMSCLSTPFVDRCEVIEFKETEPARMAGILNDYVRENIMPFYDGKVVMDDALLAAASNEIYVLGATSIRQHEKLAEAAARHAYDRYLSSDDLGFVAVTEGDFRAVIDTLYSIRRERKEIGFRS